MQTQVLKLDIAGRPLAWISREEGALLYCRDQVAWEAGTAFITLRGGHSRATGERSVLNVNSIVAACSLDRRSSIALSIPTLTNSRLFRRDRFTCLYCGEVLPRGLLTRDHVQPLSRGGRDNWENVVTACRSCNQHKDNRLLDEIGMRLLAIPYIPNRAEGLLLENRRILADQMEFLRMRIGRMSRFSP